jgi:hypothetical protein
VLRCMTLCGTPSKIQTTTFGDKFTGPQILVVISCFERKFSWHSIIKIFGETIALLKFDRPTPVTSQNQTLIRKHQTEENDYIYPPDTLRHNPLPSHGLIPYMRHVYSPPSDHFLPPLRPASTSRGSPGSKDPEEA